MKNNAEIEEQSVGGCQFCENDDRYDLTECGKCKTIFCIYCVGSARVGYEVYDVCPSCGDIFDW